jgi:hypothetical protein
MRDITDDLNERMAKLQEELEAVKRRRQELDVNSGLSFPEITGLKFPR